MAFAPADVDRLLAETGRMCAVCNRLHDVQVHHIDPKENGGPDTYENAIPLCPNCHNEMHTGYAPGRVTRMYTEAELRGHLARTKKLAEQQGTIRPGDEVWSADVERLRFFGQCLDRPAFQHPFHNELSFNDFDQAMEDTVLAINTGYWRTRDGTVIERGEGKAHLVNPEWRKAMDEVVRLVGQVRIELREALRLNAMLMSHEFDRMSYDSWDEMLRWDGPLAGRINQLRTDAVARMNVVLAEAGLNPLQSIDS